MQNTTPAFLDSQSPILKNRKSDFTKSALVLSSVAKTGQGGETPISSPPQLVNVGYDTVVVNYKLRCQNGEMFVKMAERKKELQAGVGLEIPFNFVPSGKFAWSLHRTGTKLHSYILSSGDVRMCLSPRSHNSTIPNCQLTIGSISSNNNPLELLAQWRRWMKYCGFVVIEEKVSRIDLCCDIKININKTDCQNQDRIVSRCHKFAIYYENRKLSGVMIGRGDVACRIYDKQNEMREKQAVEKATFFNELWKTELTDDVVRVEFQIRREVIKQLVGDRTTFDDVERSSDCIWKYLTQDWLRLCEKDIDRKNRNQDKAKESAFWQLVQSAVIASTPKATRKRRIKFINIEPLTKQAVGCLMNIAAAVGHVSDDVYGIIKTLTDVVTTEIFRQNLDEKEFNQNFFLKQKKALITF